jgi:PilZ domain
MTKLSSFLATSLLSLRRPSNPGHGGVARSSVSRGSESACGSSTLPARRPRAALWIVRPFRLAQQTVVVGAWFQQPALVVDGGVREEKVDGTMKRRIGDRRGKPRFEIVGDLWGSIDTSTSLTLKNLGRGGALLDSPLPLAPDSVHWVTALADGESHAVQMRVRHSTTTNGNGGSARYLIGVEFLKLSPGLEEFIVRQVVVDNGNVSVEA